MSLTIPFFQTSLTIRMLRFALSFLLVFLALIVQFVPMQCSMETGPHVMVAKFDRVDKNSIDTAHDSNDSNEPLYASPTTTQIPSEKTHKAKVIKKMQLSIIIVASVTVLVSLCLSSSAIFICYKSNLLCFRRQSHTSKTSLIPITVQHSSVPAQPLKASKTAASSEDEVAVDYVPPPVSDSNSKLTHAIAKKQIKEHEMMKSQKQQRQNTPHLQTSKEQAAGLRLEQENLQTPTEQASETRLTQEDFQTSKEQASGLRLEQENLQTPKEQASETRLTQEDLQTSKEQASGLRLEEENLQTSKEQASEARPTN